MNIGYLGSSHRDVSLVEIEKGYLQLDQSAIFWAYLKEVSEIKELVVLPTCNRIEFYFVADDLELAKASLLKGLSEFLGCDLDFITRLYGYHFGDDALTHLFRVSAGLESMIFGENEILSQLKKAYQFAMTSKTSGPVLNKVFNCAISAGKRVRTDTTIGKGAYSISSVAIDLVKEQSPSFEDLNILVVGVGAMGRRLLIKLQAIGHRHLSICNKTDRKAIDLSIELGTYYVPYYELKENLSQFDVIFYATGATYYLLTADDQALLKSQVSLVDLGVPRNIDPALNEAAQVHLLTISDFQNVTLKTQAMRKDQIQKVLDILTEEMSKLKSWASHREYVIA